MDIPKLVETNHRFLIKAKKCAQDLRPLDSGYQHYFHSLSNIIKVKQNHLNNNKKLSLLT